MIKRKTLWRVPLDYIALMFICGLFVIFAFISSSPMAILRDFVKINTSRSVLVSDYIAMAGLSAALVNSAVSCLMFLVLLILTKKKPNGKIISALFLTLGFALFGKNIVNTIPLCIGVWIFAKIHKDSFGNHIVYAMCAASISPIVSEIAFAGGKFSIIRFVVAYAVGVFVGIIFPVVVEGVKKMHHGYCLYNAGIAGGFTATFIVGIFRGMGYEIVPEDFWSTEYTLQLAIGAYAFAVAAIIYGLIVGGRKEALKRFRQIIMESDRNDNDYFLYYGGTCYINIGVMCIIATTTMLVLGIPINGPVLGGIITIAGFAAAGKHVRNTVPVLIGSILGAHFNYMEVDASANALSILFSTGLAPIACKFGWIWGIVAGFMHVSVAISIGLLNGGLNLYNNGFAGGFVAITLVPLIFFFDKWVLKKDVPNMGNFYGRRKDD